MLVQVNISSPVVIILTVVLGLLYIQYHMSSRSINSQHHNAMPEDHHPVYTTDDTRQQKSPDVTADWPRSYSTENPQSQAPVTESKKPPQVNFRPVIGIITQEAVGHYESFGDSLIFPAHVRWNQMSGANVIPIWANETQEYYERIIKQINGLYLPGGHPHPTNSSYGRMATTLLKLAIKENDRGVYFPVWATCLGLQFLMCNACGKTVTYSCMEMLKRTKFVAGPDYEDSFIKKNVPSEVLPALFDKVYMPHGHKQCVSMKTYNECPESKKFFKVVSVNTDNNGTEYISTLEARNYPIYSVQWHPEKFSFHWNIKAQTPHTSDAIRLGQVLGDFFVSEARRNNHTFDDPSEEEALFMENFQLSFVGRPGYASFYFFTSHAASLQGLEERKQLIAEYRRPKRQNSNEHKQIDND